MSLLNSLIVAVARLWPLGLSPFAPGTMGSLGAVVAAPWLFLPYSFPVRIALLLVIFCLGALAATRAEAALGLKDPSSVVIDELVGQWLTLLLVTSSSAAVLPGPMVGPEGARIPVMALLVGFVLFRLFDIWKPGPVRASESWMDKGWGIMIDDVVAGVFALACMAVFMQIASRLWG